MSITDFIPGFTWIKFAPIALGLAVAGSAGAYAGYRWEEVAYLTQMASDAESARVRVELAARDQKAQDDVDLNASTDEAFAQGMIQGRTATLTLEVPKYVTVKQDAIVCIPVGLARFMRAAAAGADPATVELAPGQSYDACSDITATEMAGWISDFAGEAQANGEQLNALQAWIVANHQAQVQP